MCFSKFLHFWAVAKIKLNLISLFGFDFAFQCLKFKAFEKS